MHLRMADAGVSGKRAQETPALVIAHNGDRFHRHGGIKALDAEREIASGAAAMALFPKELRMAVFSRPMRHHAVVVNAPCAARDKAAALGFPHDQPAFRTFSVISLSAASSRMAVRPLFFRLA